MKIRVSIVLPLLLIMLLLAPISESRAVLADRGAITNNPGIIIYEPAQLAVISWYGGREILYLSSVLKIPYDEKVEIVEILPLPSVPKIELGNKKVFENLSNLMSPPVMTHGEKGPGSGEGGVIFNRVLGPHNVTLIYVNDTDYFRTVIRGFFTNTSNPIYIRDYIIDFYIEKGYRYFAVDVITLHPSDQLVMVEPIIYEFDTPKLYYPMMISKLNHGYFKAKLFIITSCYLSIRIFDALNVKVQIYNAKPFWRWDLSRIDSRLIKLFPFWMPYIYVNYFEITGVYSALSDKDLEISITDYYGVVQVIVFITILLAYSLMLILNKKVNINFIKQNIKSLSLYSLLVFIPLIIYFSNIPYVYLSQYASSINDYATWMNIEKSELVINNVRLVVSILVFYFPLLSVLGLTFFYSKLKILLGSVRNVSFWRNPPVISIIIASIYTYVVSILITYVYLLMYPYEASSIIVSTTMTAIIFVLILVIFIIAFSIISIRSNNDTDYVFWNNPGHVFLVSLDLYLFLLLGYLAFAIFIDDFYDYMFYAYLIFFIWAMILLVTMLTLIILRYVSQLRT